MSICGHRTCGRTAQFEVSVPSYQQTACPEHLVWAVYLMQDTPVMVRLLAWGE